MFFFSVFLSSYLISGFLSCLLHVIVALYLSSIVTIAFPIIFLFFFPFHGLYSTSRLTHKHTRRQPQHCDAICPALALPLIDSFNQSQIEGKRQRGRKRWGMEQKKKVGQGGYGHSAGQLCRLAPLILVRHPPHPPAMSPLHAHFVTHQHTSIHTSATRQTDQINKQATAFLCPEDRDVEPPACPPVQCTCICQRVHECG